MGRITPRNIMVLFISIMGPKTRKLKIEPVLKSLTKVREINASTVEHTERTNARPCMTITDDRGPEPAAMIRLGGITVCTSAANSEPMTR